MTAQMYARALAQHGSKKSAAVALGIPRQTFCNRLEQEQTRGFVRYGRKDRVWRPKDVPSPVDVRGEKADSISFPRFPHKHPDTETIINRLAAETARKERRARAEKWFRITVTDPKPIGVLWFGDPHLGVLCDWVALKRDVGYCASVPGLYGANIGDVADNWVGSLMRIAAEQDISRRTERQLAKWFLTEAGITWLVWLFGNHDEWNDGSDIMRLMDIHNKVPMFDWAAKFELRFPNGKKIRVHASHDFPGHSMWNSTHGPARAPRMLGNGADLYVCGHKHTWGIQQFEMPDADLCPVAVRVRGYKRGDPHARRLGFPEDQHACSVLTIFDPTAGPAGRVLAFPDVDQGVKVLRALRGEAETKPKHRRKVAKRST